MSVKIYNNNEWAMRDDRTEGIIIYNTFSQYYIIYWGMFVINL